MTIAGEGKTCIDPSNLVVAIGERRDRAAFSTLFQNFAPRVKNYMVRSGLSHELAEELTQECLLNVWRGAYAYDPARASVTTWIFAIARNTRISNWRQARQFLPADDPTVETPDPTPPDQIMLAEHEAARVRKAIEILSDKQAEAVRHVFFAEKSHSQAATDLGLPVGTVKSRLRLAYAQLRVRLTEVS